jgi:hypothetical protein
MPSRSLMEENVSDMVLAVQAVAMTRQQMSSSLRSCSLQVSRISYMILAVQAAQMPRHQTWHTRYYRMCMIRQRMHEIRSYAYEYVAGKTL